MRELYHSVIQEHFQNQIKPYLPAASSWGTILIIFISIRAAKADFRIVQRKQKSIQEILKTISWILIFD